MRAFPTLLALAICGASGLASADAPIWHHARLICNPERKICLLINTDLSDLDRDGVPDIDEKAAGTDPTKIFSKPTNLDILTLAARGSLPSFDNGDLLIVVLPTEFPADLHMPSDSFVLGPAAELQSKLGWPMRHNTLDSIGLTNGALKGVELDQSNGLVIASSLTPAGFNQVKTPNGLGFKVGNLRYALVSNGTYATQVSSAASSMASGPNGGKGVSSASVDGAAGTATANYVDGSKDEASWASAGGASSESVTSYNSKGEKIGNTTLLSSSTNNGNGTYTETELEYHQFVDKDGTRVSTTSQSDKIRDDTTGEIVGTLDLQRSTSVYTDGSSQTYTTIAKVVNNGSGGSTTTYTVTNDEKDAQGNFTSTQTTVTTTVTDSQGNATTTTTSNNCTGTAQQSGCTPIYDDPDAQTNTVSITPELMKEVETKKHFNTTPGPLAGEPAEFEWPKIRPGSIEPIALYDGEGNLAMTLVAPEYWNSAKGTENYGPSGPPSVSENQPMQNSSGNILGLMSEDLGKP